MAKVTGPLLSLSASGTVGKALTFANWKGINTARIASTPSNPKTVNQMANRAFLAAGGKVTKVTDPASTEATFLRTKTPAGQSYASYFVREMLGTGNVNMSAAKTAYNLGGNAAAKAIFDTAAATINLESVDLDGTTNTQVPAGMALWAAYAASYRLGSASTPADPTVATQPQADAYADAINLAV